MIRDFQHAFRSGALQRAAGLRADASLWSRPDALTYVLWRGKLLVDDSGQPVLLPADHPALQACREQPVFVGLVGEAVRFVADLTFFQPVEDATTIGQFVDVTRQPHPLVPGAGFAEMRGLMPSLSLVDAEAIATGRALTGWHASHRFCAACGTPTLPELNGWQRKCPQCATQHFPRTDPVVIMAIAHGDRLLLGRGATWPERMYSLLAGFVEPGETIESAVRRETIEEAGIRVGSVRYVASQPWPFPMSLMFGCIGEALSHEITVDPVELTDARWVSRDEVRQILAGGHAEIAAPRKGAIAGALIEAWSLGRMDDVIAEN